jgi:hypothetical protein
MSEFVRKVVDAARAMQENQVSEPIAVAGLADTVRDAVASMARARHTADRLKAGSQRLVGNISAVDSLNAQLDTANEQLEGAIQAIGGTSDASSPLDVSSSSGNDSPASTQGEQTTADASDPKGAQVNKSDGSVVQPAAPLGGATPEEGIQRSLAHVQGANA